MVSKKDIDIKKINEKIEKDSAFIDLLVLEINKSIVGQKKYDREIINWSVRTGSHFT